MNQQPTPDQSPVIGVLGLQGDVREHRAMAEAAGASTRVVRRVRELDGLDGLIIPGGESTTMIKLADAFGLTEPIQGALREGLPAFGTCAGLIMLADQIEDGIAGQRTFGSLDVVVRRNAFGSQVESFEVDLDLVGLDAPFHAVFIRGPWVESVGPDVEVVASVASGPAAGKIVAVRQGGLLATSFHPEIGGDTRIHQLFVDGVRKGWSE